MSPRDSKPYEREPHGPGPREPRGSRDATYYGRHACRALADRRPEQVHRAFLTRATQREFGDLTSFLARERRPYRVVEDDELARVAGTGRHEGVALVADPLPPVDTGAWLDALAEGPSRVLFLDGVDNPHNVGAILRSAAHFGVAGLAGLADELPAPSGALARVAEGAIESVPMLRWNNPHRGLDALRGLGFAHVATVVEGGRPLHEVELPARCVFLIGSESAGLGESAREIADISVTIGGTGAVESLNVAAATAVLLADHWRRFGTSAQ